MSIYHEILGVPAPTQENIKLKIMLDLNYNQMYEINTTSRHYEGSMYPLNELLLNTKTKQFYKSISSFRTL